MAAEHAGPARAAAARGVSTVVATVLLLFIPGLAGEGRRVSRRFPGWTISRNRVGVPDVSMGRTPTHPGAEGPPLTELLRTALSEEAWAAFSRGSAIRRAGRAGFARNVCVAMGNWLGATEDPDAAAVRLLERALSAPEPMVRGHAVWALGMVGSGEARDALESQLEAEDDPWVREEIGWAVGR